jgi:putative ABC transport system permease protein
MLMRLLRRASYLLRRDRHARDLAEEMEFHRSLLARRSLGEGGSGGPAFGNVTLAREDARAVWIWRWADDAWQDARYAARSMLRQPAFAAAAIAIVALGTGATTCVFGLFDALVVKSLPVERPQRLVWFGSPAFSYPVFRTVQSRMPVFEGMFGWNLDRAYVDWNGAGGDLAPADVLEATGEFFPTLRVRAALGRTFDTNDVAVAVISHASWQRRFGSDPTAVGRTIRVGGTPLMIVGVAPAGFFGVTPGIAPEVFVPIAGRHNAADSIFVAVTSSWLHMMARLRDGVSREQAEAALQTIWPQVMEDTTSPDMPTNRRAMYLGRKTSLEPGRTGYSTVRNQFGDPLRVLMGLVGLLLAIACASVANLLLARGVARRREIAVRLAIGAKRARIFRQLVTESLVVTLAGAAIGVVLASWASGLLVAFLTTSRDRLALDTAPGWRTIGFGVALALGVAALAALFPAIRASRGDVTDGLKEYGQAGGGLLRRWSAGKALVAIQVALALVLLAGAAIFSRSLSRILAQDTGIDADRLLVVTADAAAAGYKGPAQRQFDLQVLERLRGLPGVDAAALSWMPPISNTMGNWTQSIMVDGVPPEAARYVFFNGVSPKYFDTLGMHLRRGRDLADSDSAASAKVVVVNETLARTYFGAQDPIGHRIAIGKAASRKDLEIVGVVQDAKYRTLQEPARSIAYLSIAQVEDVTSGRDLFATVRAASLPAIEAAARQVVRSIDPNVPVHAETVANRIRESTLTERLIAMLAGALGVAALVLACAGLYGLLAYAVSRHSREIGLRIALGARPASVLWLVQRESLVLTVIGIAMGLGGALALGRFIRTMLFEITPGDPIALAAASASMLVVAAGATYLPARRAAGVDPVVALKRDS